MNNIEKLAEPTEQEYLAHAEEEELLLFASESDYLAIANGVWELFVKRAKALQQSSEPVAYCVYFPDEPRQEYCQSLDEITDALTNERHDITPLFTLPPASVPLEKYNKVVEIAKKALTTISDTSDEGYTDISQDLMYISKTYFKTRTAQVALQAIAEAELSEGKEG